MGSAVAAVGSVKAGLCPHGMPPAACPICSGMMGGGATANRKTNPPPGEMTYHQCVIMGQILEMQRKAAQRREDAAQNHLVAMQQFYTSMDKMSAQLKNFIQTMTGNPSPAIKAAVFVAANIILPIVTALRNLPTNIHKAMEFINQKLADITSKLTAIYGEIKTALLKKADEIFKNVKKKIISLFHIFETTEENSEEKEIETEKRIFELKTFIHELYSKLTEEEEKNEHNTLQ